MCIKLTSSTFKWFCLLCCACNLNYDQCTMMKSYVEHSNENHWAALFLAVLFISLYKVVLTFEFVWVILKCDHSNERFGLFPLSNLLTLQGQRTRLKLPIQCSWGSVKDTYWGSINTGLKGKEVTAWTEEAFTWYRCDFHPGIRSENSIPRLHKLFLWWCA